MEKNEKTKRVGVLNKFSLDLAALVDKEKGRYLNGIHVTSEFTEVTNGSYAMRIDNVKIDPDDYPNGPNGEKIYTEEIDAMISDDVAKRIQKSIPGIRSASLPILQNAVPGQNIKKDGTNMELITYDLEVWNPINFRPIEERYPNIDAVFPKDKSEMELGFNPDFMIRLCQQFKKNGVKVVKLSLYNANCAMQLEGKNSDTDQEIKALLMPCKV